jgi:hypothetical protein
MAITCRPWNPYGRVVEQHLCHLRRKLGEDARRPRIIRSVWGRGLTLAVPVDEDTDVLAVEILHQLTEREREVWLEAGRRLLAGEVTAGELLAECRRIEAINQRECLS